MLHQSVFPLRLAVLIVPCSLEVCQRRQSVLLQLGSLLLDDGKVCLDLGEGVVAELVRMVDVGSNVGVRRPEVRVEGCNDVVVGVGGKGQDLGAVRV